MITTFKPDVDAAIEYHRRINTPQRRRLIPASEMTIWRWEKIGKFPKRSIIGGRAYWFLGEVLDAIGRRHDGGRGQ
jgi:prophage regulatory protein